MNSRTIWITGLSGAGKSTIARELQSLCQEQGLACVLLDGDEVREAIGDETCGHDPESRLVNAYRICRLAKMLSKQRTIVIVATMSLFHEIHAWNRDNLPGYFEVYLDVDMVVLQTRDPKGLYQKASRKQETNVGGLHLEIQPPREPHLRVANNGPADDAPRIARYILTEAGLIQPSGRISQEKLAGG